MTDQEKGAKLSLEDNARMTRLHEEIAARVAEMALIGARNLNLASKFPVGQFILSTRIRRNDEGVIIEFGPCAEITLPDGTIVCWCDPPGICYIGPCP